MSGDAARRDWAVLVAAGRGARMGSDTPKQYLDLCGRPVLAWSLDALLAAPWLAGVVVVLAADDERFDAVDIARDPRVTRTIGGGERADSVRAGLDGLRALGAGDHDRVFVHDAARPCLRGEDLDALRAAADASDGALLAAPLADTLKRGDDHVETTVPRARLWRALTPQCFPLAALATALDRATAAGIAITDEASAMEQAGHRPRLVAGAPDNLKITLPSDLPLAAAVLHRQRRVHTMRAESPHPPVAPPLRIGHGYDLHRLEVGDGLVIGGVRIACDWRVIAHSDGDVALHALCDALLGAAGLGDIGRHFPDTDPAFAGADSRELLRTVVARVAEAGWTPVNADISVIAQVPKLAPHIDTMRAAIAADLGLDAGAVNVKATTHEGVDAVGEKRAVAAHAVCLLGRGG